MGTDVLSARIQNDNILVGVDGLVVNNDIVASGDVPTTIVRSDFPIDRLFEHRVRLEVESLMGTPITSEWTTHNKQQLSNVIATFPIWTKTSTTIECDTMGIPTGVVLYQNDEFRGDIVWRRAEDKISERYRIKNSQFFHNIRLNVHIVRREWNLSDNSSFIYKREVMQFSNSENWSAKLRFRSV